MDSITALTLKAVLSLDDSEFNQSLSDVEQKSSSFGSGLASAAKVGAAAVAAAGTAITGFGAVSVKTGMEFDSSMAQVAATMGKTTDEIGELRDFALEMGSTTAFSASQAADALNYMALAGYDADQSMEMLPNVLNLAAAGSMELATASDMVTDAQSALGLEMNEMTGFVDQLAKTSSKSNTSVQQLGDAILTVGGTAKTLSGGTTELNTALGILADNGIKGAEGGTHLRNAILSLSAPTDTAAAALKDLGVQTVDTEGNLRPMQDIMADLGNSLDGLGSAERAEVISTIFNKTDIAAVNALLDTSSERWDELSAAIDDSAGAAQAMADTQLDNLAGDITIFQSALEGAKIAISDVLTPALREFVQFGSDGLSQLTEAFKEGGLSGAMEVFGQLLSDGLAMIVEGLPQAIDAGMQLIGALGQGIIDNIPTFVSAAMQIIETFVTYLIEAVPALIQGGVSLIQSLVEGIVSALPTLIPAALQIIQSLVTSLIDSIPLLIDAAVELVTQFADYILNNVNMLIDTAISLIMALVQGLITNLPKIIEAGVKLLSSLINGIIKALPQLVATVPKLILAFVNMIISSLPTILANGVKIVGAIIEGIVSMLGSIAQSAISLVTEFISSIVGGFGDILSTGKDIVSKVGDGINGAIDSAIEWGKDLISNFIDGLFQKWEDLKKTVSDIAGSIADYLGFSEPDKGPLSNFHTYAPDMMDLFIQGIKSKEKDLKQQLTTVADIVANVFDGIKNSMTIKSNIIGLEYNLWEDEFDAGNQQLMNISSQLEDAKAYLEFVKTQTESAQEQIENYYDGLIEAAQAEKDAAEEAIKAAKEDEDKEEEEKANKAKENAQNRIDALKKEAEEAKKAAEKQQEDAQKVVDSLQKTYDKLSDTAAIEKYKQQHEMLTKQMEEQKKVIEGASAAYDKLVEKYGENSDEALKAKETLMSEVQSYNELEQSLNSLATAEAGLNRKYMFEGMNLTNQIISSVSDSIGKQIPQLSQAGEQITYGIANGITSEGAITTTSNSLVTKFIESLNGYGDNLSEEGKAVVGFLDNGVEEKGDVPVSWGKDLIDNFIMGIDSKKGALRATLEEIASMVDDYIGFSEPEKGPLSRFHTFAPDMIDLFAQGIRDGKNLLANTVADTFDFSRSMNLDTTGVVGGGGNNSYNVTMNIYGAQGQDINELAEIINLKLGNTIRRNDAVWA